MSNAEIEEGKKWVETKLREIIAKNGLSPSDLSWCRADGDFTKGLESLAYRMSDKRHLIRFSEENLEDCPNDHSVKLKLEKQLNQFVRVTASPEPKIGFKPSSS